MGQVYIIQTSTDHVFVLRLLAFFVFVFSICSCIFNNKILFRVTRAAAANPSSLQTWPSWSLDS